MKSSWGSVRRAMRLLALVLLWSIVTGTLIGLRIAAEYHAPGWHVHAGA